MNLTQLAIQHGTDKHWHGYIPYYEQHFGYLRDHPVNLLEIGVASGASMYMWEDWFKHPDARLTGMEIEPETDWNPSERGRLITGDGTKLKINEEFDIIVDDGSHISYDILKSFDLYWNTVKPDGWYVIEDLAVQWREDYGGNANGGPVLRRAYDILDEIVKGLSPNFSEFHAYDEIIFLRKLA
jgi:hypothetical protein